MRQSFQNGAIVLGGEVNGLAVIRSLGRLGVQCGALISPNLADYARHTRYAQYLNYVPEEAADDELVSGIEQIARRLGSAPCVIIPTTDRYSQFLSRNDEMLAKQHLICNPQRSLCDAFLDKWQTAELCRTSGVFIPQTACPQTTMELVRVAGTFSYPVIVKPRYTFGSGFPGKNAVFEEPDDLLRFLEGSSLLGKCVIQQIVPSGDGDILVTATYSSGTGKVEAIYSGRKIRQYLPDYGATCFGISERNSALEENTRTFLDSIGYRGFAALEFARSRIDGRAYFLELNTRTYYHNQLFADAGIDLTQVAFLSSIGDAAAKVLGSRPQHEGLLWLDIRRDYQSMRIKRRQGQITAAEWVFSIVRARSFACWNWRDPVPFFMASIWRLRELARNMVTRVLKGSPLARGNTT